MIKLQQGEEIIWKANPHPVSYLPRALLFLLGALVLGVGTWYAASGMSAHPHGITLAVTLLPLGIAYAWLYLRWRCTVYLVTTHRLVRSEGIIGRHVVSLALERIQDVTYSVSIFGRLLDCGAVAVESAGASSRLVFSYAPSPAALAERIMAAARSSRASSLITCARCGKKLDASWNLCPFCGREISPLGVELTNPN